MFAYSFEAIRRFAYGRVMEVMGALNRAGFNNLALVTEPRTGGER